jgi:hypothetical protein
LLPQLNPGIAAPTVPASAPWNPRHGQSAVGQLDHGDAIAGIPGLSRPGLNHEIQQPAIPAHQQLQPTADAQQGNPPIAGPGSAEFFSPLNRPFHGQPPVGPGKLPGPDVRPYQSASHRVKRRPPDLERYRALLASRPQFTGQVQPALRRGDLALTSTRFPGGATAEIARRQSDGSWLWAADQPRVVAGA